MRILVPAVLSCLLASVGCVQKSGRLESNRFQHERYPYAVFYAEGGSQEHPLGAAWRVDNYVQQRGRYEPNPAPSYVIERAYEISGGRKPYQRQEQLYDLRLVHAQKEAELFVRTIPLSTTTSELDLRVLAERYVDAIADAQKLAPAFGPERTDSTGQSAAHRTDELSCTLSQRDAFRIDFDLPVSVADKAQSPKRGSVVVVRTGYVERVFDGASGAGAYPVLMVIAFATRPDDYAALEPDLEKLLTQTVLGDMGMGLSMKGGHTCTRGTSTGGEAPTAPAQESGEGG